jgi:hypothetical protein
MKPGLWKDPVGPISEIPSRSGSYFFQPKRQKKNSLSSCDLSFFATYGVAWPLTDDKKLIGVLHD